MAIDLTGFWRPHLKNCPSTHYQSVAGRALPAIPLGLVARIGKIKSQRYAVPLALVRAEPHTTDAHHNALLVAEARRHCSHQDIVVADAGFPVALLLQSDLPHFLVRDAINSTYRRKQIVQKGRGRYSTKGELIRPLQRMHKTTTLAASSPDVVETWKEKKRVVTAEIWRDVVLNNAQNMARSDNFKELVGAEKLHYIEQCTTALRSLSVFVIRDPRYKTPLLLVSSDPLSAVDAYHLYKSRWGIENLPLVAKQMIGMTRQFVHEPETCQRLPELGIISAAILAYAAATTDPIPTGFWDRAPKPTSGRLRRALMGSPFPQSYVLPPQLRKKNSCVRHLRTGNRHVIQEKSEQLLTQQ